MGTNYYMQYKSKTCKCCNRTDKQIHIGKSSYGWTFNFRGYREDWNVPKIVSVEDWKKELSYEDTYIVDEYGDVTSKDGFWNMALSKEKYDRNHAMLHKEGNWLDKDGNSFSGNEFS